MVKTALHYFLLDCYAPSVILIPGGSTFSSPLQFRRSQDFSIISIIELNCNGSLTTSSKLTIKNCSSMCSFEMELTANVITTLSELYIPSRSLPYGNYELTLTVTMTDTPILQSSSSAYVTITASGVTANLIQLGTSIITRGNQQDLLLDPGSFSVDPDEDSFDASVSIVHIDTLKIVFYCFVILAMEVSILLSCLWFS
jgi:hypothetical protein